MATTCDQALLDAHKTIGRVQAIVWDLWDYLDKDELQERLQDVLQEYGSSSHG